MAFKKKMLTALFLMTTALLLQYPRESVLFALKGLTLWAEKMVPTLFPFMILSGVMIRMNLTESFGNLTYPILHPLFGVNKNGAYAIFMGFLCGFPMGAKVVGELYLANKLEKKQASFLLAFCNNIGPIYFTGFVLPSLGIRKGLFLCLFGMYGLPLLYGFFLKRITYPTGFVAFTPLPKEAKIPSLLYQLDEGIHSAITNITMLGGYMMLFQVLTLFPYVLTLHPKFWANIPFSREVFLALSSGLLEITGGISSLSTCLPYMVLLLLPLGGGSCFAQTFSMLRNTDLSKKEYFLHKIRLTILTCLYYGGIFVFFPGAIA